MKHIWILTKSCCEESKIILSTCERNSVGTVKSEARKLPVGLGKLGAKGEKKPGLKKSRRDLFIH